MREEDIHILKDLFETYTGPGPRGSHLAAKQDASRAALERILEELRLAELSRDSWKKEAELEKELHTAYRHKVYDLCNYVNARDGNNLDIQWWYKFYDFMNEVDE